MNILSRLSVKCLLRLRCVSKPFCSLIDSQKFVKTHLNRSIETDFNLSVILSYTPAPMISCSRYGQGKIFSASLDSLNIAVELDHPFKNCTGETPIIDTCNGLIALKNGENDIALWNPSTKKHVLLPKFWSDFDDYADLVDGFGYDAVSDDYKVVRLIQFGRGKVEYTEIAVYSLKSNSSRRIRVDFPYYFSHPRDGTFARGHVHWLVLSEPEGYNEDLIVAFDLKSEEFFEVPLPHLENRDSGNLMYMGNFSGCLYFSCFCDYPEPVDIWIMKESWTKVFSFAGGVFGIFTYAKALAYSKSGDKVLVDKFLYDEDEDEGINKWELGWYDLQNQRAAGQVTVHGVPQGCRYTMIYVDSLIQKEMSRGRPTGKEGRTS